MLNYRNSSPFTCFLYGILFGYYDMSNCCSSLCTLWSLEIPKFVAFFYLKEFPFVVECDVTLLQLSVVNEANFLTFYSPCGLLICLAHLSRWILWRETRFPMLILQIDSLDWEVKRKVKLRKKIFEVACSKWSRLCYNFCRNIFMQNFCVSFKNREKRLGKMNFSWWC